MSSTVAGMLLAAGAGRRMGSPKALLRDGAGTAWVVSAARRLHEAGCAPVRVVVGAGAGDVRELLAGEDVEVVEATGWASGMAASLRAGLAGFAACAPDADAVLVHLVDLPDVGADVLRRVARSASRGGLARAVYAGRPGHPVLLGRHHWSEVARSAQGDAGARGYLVAHDVRAVECSDLASGHDVDTPPG